MNLYKPTDHDKERVLSSKLGAAMFFERKCRFLEDSFDAVSI